VIKRPQAVIVVLAVAVCTPITPPPFVGDVVGLVFGRPCERDSFRLGSWVRKSGQTSLDIAYTVEKSKIRIPMRIVTAGTSELGALKRTAWRHGMAAIGYQSVPYCNNIVARRIARYRVQPTVGAIIEIVLEEKYEIPCPPFGRRV